MSVNLLFLLVHCLYIEAETIVHLSTGNPTTTVLQSSHSWDWSLGLERKNNNIETAVSHPSYPGSTQQNSPAIKLKKTASSVVGSSR